MVIVELEALGHRLRYVRLLADARPGRCVLLVPAAVRDAPEFAEHLASPVAEGSLVVEVLPSDDRRAALETALAVAARHGAELIVLPDGDKHVAPLLAVLPAAHVRARLGRGPRPPRVTVLLMRTALPGGPEKATPGMVAKPALVAALRRVPGVRLAFLTDAFGVVSARRGFPAVTPVRDPVALPARAPVAASPVLRTAPGLLRIGVFGVVSQRKNLPVLLAAVDTEPRVAIVVGGRCEPDVRALLDTDPIARRLVAQGRLVVDDRLLDEAEFDAGLRSVHAVAVLHDNDAPSGIVAEANGRGVPVLGPDRGWVAHVLRATGAGQCARVDDPADVRAALVRLLDAREEYVAAARAATERLGIDDFVTGLLGSAV